MAQSLANLRVETMQLLMRIKLKSRDYWPRENRCLVTDFPFAFVKRVQSKMMTHRWAQMHRRKSAALVSVLELPREASVSAWKICGIVGIQFTFWQACCITHLKSRR